MTRVIYLDNSATTVRKPPEVLAAVADAMTQSGNSGRGAHGASLESGRSLFATRTKAARLFHAVGPDHVVFTANASAALNTAIAGLLRPGDHAVCTDLEHNSVLRPLHAAAQRGVDVTVVESSCGVVDVRHVVEALRANTTAVVMTHGSNVLGTVQPIEQLAALSRDRGFRLIVDAAQTAGLLPISMRDGYAAVCCAGHKSLLGPQGTGLLVLGEGVLPTPLLVGGTGFETFNRSMPGRLPEALEAGTQNGPGIAGLGAGVQVVLDAGGAEGPTTMWRTAMDRAGQLREGLAAMGSFAFAPIDMEAWRLPIVAGNLIDPSGAVLDSEVVAARLWELAEIAMRGGFHCAPLLHERYGTTTVGMVRFSPGHDTTVEDIETTLAVLAGIQRGG